MDTFYFCGGLFPTSDPDKKEFSLVAPTHGLPYVTRGEDTAEKLNNLCQHHSHLYQWDAQNRRAVLMRTNWEAEAVHVEAPQEYGLTEAQVNNVIESIKMGCWGD